MTSIEVTWAARSSPQGPVFGSPKKVGVQRRFPTRPADGGVVVLDQVVRPAGEHRLSKWIWRQGRCLPWLRLDFGHHPSPAAFTYGHEQRGWRFCSRTVCIERPRSQPQEGVSWIVVEAHDVGELPGQSQRV